MAIIIAAGIVGIVAIVGSSDSYSDYYDDYDDYSDYYDDYAVREAQRRAEKERKQRELQSRKNDLELYINNEIDDHIIQNDVNVDVPKWTSSRASFNNFDSDFSTQKECLNKSIYNNQDKLKKDSINTELNKIDDILNKIDGILDKNS